MSPNPKTAFTAPANPSTPGTSEWLYDEIMRFIEPDLLTTTIPKHPEMYKDETHEQRVARMTAYDQAFVIFDKVTESVEKELKEKMDAVRAQAKKKAMKEDKKSLKKIEDEIDASEK